MKIKRSVIKDGRGETILYGVVAIIDGLVRILSLGFLYTDLPLVNMKRRADKQMAKRKAEGLASTFR